ncbi:hypothetical protein AUEXF2481DRAFT_572403 [Aureobasidium subglaciale EXF-2481]|uniref:Uncharacterized protein n=1 Tax=Aureobasidium subglaciale (strain EXF-2481) TaxID=1043005 RepID=A0A074YU24_AURSE|nr:uncharacterized protein AUEXF2481DRAFT_572403 [Aureobasidium subglaciale EXF-2481]KEQ90361.1 hypothetical protein AUEXF2481DRAFT_572403 [Aureobasidium subglaciale EXF-2481]
MFFWNCQTSRLCMLPSWRRPVFNLNAQLIFRTIIFRSLPDELASPVLIYMSLRERLATRNHSDNLTPEILQAMIDDFVVAGKTTPWPNVSTWTIFHTIAQAVRIHDIAFSILRSKLDYFSTLQFEKLADPPRYRCYTPYDTTLQNPERVPYDVHIPLSNPSWTEETRAIRVLWLMAAGWQASLRSSCCDTDTVSGLIWSQKLILGLEHPSQLDSAVELSYSIRLGPVLRPPEESQKVVAHTFDLLQPYRIDCHLHGPNVRKSESLSLPISPQFSWTPTIAPFDRSGHRKRLSTFEMLRLNSSLARIRIKTDRRPDGRLFGTNARIFENFGFGFWYEERLIDELWLNCRGYRVGDPQPKIDWNNLPHNYCTASDEHFRPLKLYQQQVEREQQGWHR